MKINEFMDILDDLKQIARGSEVASNTAKDYLDSKVSEKNINKITNFISQYWRNRNKGNK